MRKKGIVFLLTPILENDNISSYIKGVASDRWGRLHISSSRLKSGNVVILRDLTMVEP